MGHELEPNLSKKQRTKEYWQEIISKWQASNQSQRKFCLTHGLNKGTFSYWRTMFLTEKTKNETNTFIPLKINVDTNSIPESTSITIENPIGNKINLPLSLSRSQLVFILELLGFNHA